MEDPRKPLITGVTNDASIRNFSTLPTTYAVNQLFSGEYIGEYTDVDDLIKCGNYRFSDTTTGLPSHMEGKTGIITVLHDRVDVIEGEFGVNDPSVTAPTVIRQIAWPDGPNDITPYTRTKVNSTWGDWVTMGGNLRRVKLIESAIAQTNVMYYSFGNYTLSLPDPNNFTLGTRIGLEQYSGTGTVKWHSSAQGTLTQITTPAYAADDSGSPTTDIIGPNVYYFEIVEDDNGNRQWILDVDNDISNTITNIRETIGREILDRKAAIDAEADARVNADNAERDARIDADNAERDARVNADNAERDARIDADNAERDARIDADNAEADARADGDTNTLTSAKTYTNNKVANKDKLHKVFYVTTDAIKTSVPNQDDTGFDASYCFADGNGSYVNINELLKVIHPTFVLSTTCTAVYIPVAAEIYLGSKLTIEILAEDQSVTVYESNNPSVTSGADVVTSELFTNNTSGVLTLPFECVYDTSNDTYAWKLLCLK